jgi:pyrroline-5-carboxylate reductase
MSDTVSPAASPDADSVELAIVGGGNMGAALLGGLLAGGVLRPVQVAVVERLPERRVALEGMFPGVLVTDAIPPCRSAVLAVKPPDIAASAHDAAVAGARRVLSIAAGITTTTIRAAVDAVAVGVDVVRAMPNTPALVGDGVSAICADACSDPSALDWAEGILAAVGMVVRIDEEHFDAVTGLTGSGPAYVFAVAEALIAAGRGVGLPEELLEPMVTRLLLGSARLLAERGDPAALRRAVTSPGGTTAAGLAQFAERDLDGVIAAAVAAATARGRELGQA